MVHTVPKRAWQWLFPLRRLNIFGPQILKNVYSTIESIIESILSGCKSTSVPPTAKRYRGGSREPSTSLGPSSLPSRTSMSGGVRGRPNSSHRSNRLFTLLLSGKQ
jgi:hypothetical protein